MPSVETTLLQDPPPLAFRGVSGGLWDAIVDRLTAGDPAGSRLIGPSWPDQPNSAAVGMFDYVVPVPSL